MGYLRFAGIQEFARDDTSSRFVPSLVAVNVCRYCSIHAIRKIAKTIQNTHITTAPFHAHISTFGSLHFISLHFTSLQLSTGQPARRFQISAPPSANFPGTFYISSRDQRFPISQHRSPSEFPTQVPAYFLAALSGFNIASILPARIQLLI